MPTILIIEDEAKMRRLLELNLGDDGFKTLSAGDAETGLKLLASEPVHLVLTDLKLPGMSGLEFLQIAKQQNTALPIVVMTAFGSVETAVEAMKAGAADYVLKPFSLTEMRMVVHKELDNSRLREENRSLREALGQKYSHPNIIAISPKMQEVLATVERIAPTNSTVLLGGESGVGKDLIARAIHEKSRRASGPFVKINSTAIPENLLESELFGYEKGAFTEPPPASRANSNSPTKARSSSMKSETCRPPSRSSFSACCRSANSSDWAARAPSRSTFGFWLPPTATCAPRSKTERFAKTFITGSTWSRSISRRCASTKKIFLD
jgi:DNA-binding NtrC family response regulator